MNSKVMFQTIFLFFLLLLLSSCNAEKKKYSQLLLTKDLSEAYMFKKHYPESTFNIDSLIQELEYLKLLNSQNISEYINYKAKYPQTQHSDTIQERLYKLEWDNLKKIWSVDEVKKYINKYPESPYRAQADEWLFDNSSSGTFIDKRDNKQYNWTKIGGQIWMTSRLEYQKYYQKLVMNADYWWKYSYDEMSNAAPIGWHIATHEDWVKAIETILNTTWDKIPIVDKLNRIIIGRCFLTEAYEKEDYDIKGLTGGTNYNNVIFWSMHFNNSGQIECVSMYDHNWLFFSFDSPYKKHTVLCVKDSK